MIPLSRRQFVSGTLVAGASLGAGAPGRGVMDYGAAGDGQVDDTAAVQRAVDDGRGDLFFPKGVYRLTRPIVVDLSARGYTSLIGTGTARVVMAGAGPAFYLVGTHDGTAEPATFKDTVWDAQRLPRVSGLEIRGEHPEAIGLRLEGTVQATLTGLLVRRCLVGIQFAKRNRNPIISHCHVYHNLAVGIDFDRVDLHQAIVADNHISYNPVAGIRLAGGNMRNFQIVGNDIEYNFDVSRDGSADVLIDMTPEGSSFREGAIVGNTIQAKPSPGGANVRLIGGQLPHTGGLLAVTGNFMSHQTTNVHLVRCRGVSVTGNSICMGADRTIHLQHCANVVAAGNTIDWNPWGGAKRFPDGILIDQCRGVTLSDTIIENSFQGSEQAGGVIEVRRSEDVTISGCQVLDPRYRGIVLSDTRRCRVTGCTVVDRQETSVMRASIQVTGAGGDNVISGNIVSADSLRIDPHAAIVRDNHEITRHG